MKRGDVVGAAGSARAKGGAERAARGALGLVAALLLANVASTSTAAAEEIKVLVRYDDYGAGSKAEIEEPLFSVVRAAGGRVLVGVIPYGGAEYPRAEELPPPLRDTIGPGKLEQLRNHLARDEVSVALHGYAHRNNTPNERKGSEFAGLPADLQSRLLRTGKAALEDELRAKVDVFIPPFNNVDQNTLGALDALGFGVLSAGLGPAEPAGQLKVVPGGSLPSRMKDNLASAIRQGHFGGILVVVAHPYDFSEQGIAPPGYRDRKSQLPVADFVRMIEAIGGALDVSPIQEESSEAGRARSLEAVEQLIPARHHATVRFVSLEELREREDLSHARVRANMLLREGLAARLPILPDWLGLAPVPGYFYSREVAEAMLWKQRIVAGCLYAGMATLVFFALLPLAQESGERSRRFCRWAGLLLALAGVGLLCLVLVRPVSVAVLLSMSVSLGSALALLRVHERVLGFAPSPRGGSELSGRAPTSGVG